MNRAFLNSLKDDNDSVKSNVFDENYVISYTEKGNWSTTRTTKSNIEHQASKSVKITASVAEKLCEKHRFNNSLNPEFFA